MLSPRLAALQAASLPHDLAAGAHLAASGASGASGSSGSSIFIIPNATFVVELVIFLVVFAIVAKFILPPIQRVMNERTETIRSGLAAGDEGRAEADRLAAERARLLEGARAEVRGLLEEASRAADAALEEARRRGTAEHDRLLAEARPRLEAERDQLRQDLLGRLGGLVVDAASQVIGERVELAPHRRLIEELAVAGAPGREAGAGMAGDGSGDGLGPSGGVSPR